MKRNLAVKTVLLLSVVMLGVCMAQGKKAAAAAEAAYGDIIARPGESEVVVENTLPASINVFVNGRLMGNVKARSAFRFTVTDGNHLIKAQSTARNGGSSRDLQFFTQAKRTFFKVTAPTATSVSINRGGVYDITVANAATAPARDPEVVFEKDRGGMFDRMGTQVADQEKAEAARKQAIIDANAPPVKKSHIAVYVTGDRSANERKALGTELLAALIKSGQYIAVERSDDFLTAIDEEHVKQRSEAVDEGQIRELGKRFGVQFVCVANISHAFGEYQVSARIIDVETAAVVAIGKGSSQLRNMSDLSAVSFKIVQELLKK